jgi:glycosyltransferase involved in cell wall biosynthesis
LKNIVSYKRFDAGNGPISDGRRTFTLGQGDAARRLVSCLMVTRGNLSFVRAAHHGFMRQSWPERELVIVCDTVSDELRSWSRSAGPMVRLVEAPPGLALGDLRNLSLAHARGNYVCQWDDDDLYDPQRIAVCMRVLNESDVAAVFLSQWLMYWEARRLLVVSERRCWEGSMVARRSAIPAYLSQARGEDTRVSVWLCRHFATALIDMPHLYCYRVTGENTWNETHFEDVFSRASRVIKPAEMDGVFKLGCFDNPDFHRFSPTPGSVQPPLSMDAT